MAAAERRRTADASDNLAGISAGQYPWAIVTTPATVPVHLPLMCMDCQLMQRNEESAELKSVTLAASLCR